jgi:hypothetical protein
MDIDMKDKQQIEHSLSFISRNPVGGVGNEEVSSEFRLRKAHWEGEGNACCCLNIPKQFWQRMEIDKQSYLKVTYSENKLIVEKLVNGGIIDK